jgi:hypothetical protein
MDMKIAILGIVLIIIALILGGIQHFGMYNFYGTEDYKWYFYGALGIVGLVGVILAAWSAMKKETPMPTTTKTTNP